MKYIYEMIYFIKNEIDRKTKVIKIDFQILDYLL